MVGLYKQKKFKGYLIRPQRTDLFEDLYKEIILRSPTKEGFICRVPDVGFMVVRGLWA